MSLSAAAPPRRPSCSPLCGDEAELYRTHSQRLWWVVRRHVDGPSERIDDACATAWVVLLRAQPRRETVFAYLVTVAIHEGWRLSRADREQCPLLLHDELDGGELTLHQVAGHKSPEDQVLARETLREIAETLPARKRVVIALQALGYSYREIGELLDDSYSTVNRQLARAHRRLDPLREPIWG